MILYAVLGWIIGFIGGMVGLVLGAIRFPFILEAETGASITAGNQSGCKHIRCNIRRNKSLQTKQR